ncbi:MAG: DUF192 domain-containing protein [Candidatus Omnitrophica bacterium]|nr:DUF192 domain-containing protein [Candidatus Omnitrophota bacterium]MBD3269631.1 DUF192 domain-containing protein [Candidatus Omnitrophota bacterium]
MRVVFFVFFLSLCFSLGADTLSKETVKIEIGGHIYTFEVADSREERLKGLMFRKELAGTSGMLFVFEKADYLKFCMDNTFIPLDIAFLSPYLEILEIQTMEPMSNKVTISSVKALYALEVKQGFFKETGLDIGDTVKIVGEKN